MAAKTSLARQLEQLKLPQTSVHKEKHGSASFLYDFFEAKTIDTDFHYSVALEGFEALSKLDSYMENFKENLFHINSKSFDRGVQTKEDNERIDQLIEDYLFHIVSKYFQLTETHKTIEWLIYRYRINEYNVDALIGSVLPYHETRLFVRLLMTCPACKDPLNFRWFWLKNIQEKGVPLSKSFLLSHCASDSDFVRFISDSVMKAMQIDSTDVIFPSFYVSFCYSLLEKFPSENNISVIMSSLSKASRMKNKQLYTVIYLIFTHLCAIKKLDKQIVQQFMKYFIKNVTIETFESIAIAMNVICKQQNLTKLYVEFLDKEFVSNLKEYGQTENYEALIVAMFGTMINFISKTDDEGILQNYKDITNELLSMNKSITKMVIRSIVISINDKMNDEDRINPQAKDFYAFIIQIIENLYVDWFDDIFKSIASVEKITSLINSVRYALVQEAKVPLFIGLNHSNPIIRRKSLIYLAKNFQEMITSENKTNILYLKHVLHKNLLTELETIDPDILLDIFSIKDKMFDLFLPNEFESIAIQILNFCTKMMNNATWSNRMNMEVEDNDGDNLQYEKFFQLSNLILEIYCSNPIKHYIGQDDTIIDKLFFGNATSLTFLPYLIPSSKQQLANVQTLLNSKLAQTVDLFTQLRSKLNPILNPSHSPKKKKTMDQDEIMNVITQSIFDVIVNYLADNFDQFMMEFNKQNYLDNLSNGKVDQYSAQLLLWILALLIKSNRLSNKEQLNSLQNCTLDLLLCLLSMLKLKKLTIKMKKIEDLDGLNIMDSFINECLAFANGSLSLFMCTYTVRLLIDSVQPMDFLDDSTSIQNIDWKRNELEDSKRKYLNKIYLLLTNLAPSSNQTIQTNQLKTFKIFRDLLVCFLKKMVDSNHAFDFLSSYIANNGMMTDQISTLLLVKRLLTGDEMKALIIESTDNQTQFVLPYIIALSSPSLQVRSLTIDNLNLLYSKFEPSAIKKLVGLILKKSQAIISDSVPINQIINENDASVTKELFSAILTLLQTDNATMKISTDYRNCLLDILSYSHFTIKLDVLKFYHDKIAQSLEKKILAEDDEQIISYLITFYNNVFNEENLFTVENKKEVSFFVKFYQIMIDAVRFINSETLSATIFNVLTRNRFEKIMSNTPDVAVQLVLHILRVQFKLTGSDSNATAANQSLFKTIQKRLEKLFFDSNFIVQILNNILSIDDVYEKLASLSNASSSGPAEKRTRLEDGVSVFTTGWKLLRMILSIFKNNTKLKNTSRLVKTLFDYLKLTFMDVGDNSSEVTRQMILYSISNCVELRLDLNIDVDESKDMSGNNKLLAILLKRAQSKKKKKKRKKITSDDKMDIDDESEGDSEEPLAQFLDRINVDVIIDCIRESRLKETQTVALFLISSIAPYFKQQILDYLVTIFTFIGTNLLQCDDQYSLSILFDTMESIVPIIIENDDNSVDKKISQSMNDLGEINMRQYIISIFVKSFNDIPSYRRLPLFEKLVKLLNEQEYLPVLAFKLLEQSSLIKTKTANTEREVWTLFLLELFQTFDIKLQISSVCILLRLFSKLFFENYLRKKLLKKNLIEKTEEEESTPKDVLKQLSYGICSTITTKLSQDADKATCGIAILRFIVLCISNSEFVEAIKQVEYNQVSNELIYFINILMQLIVSLSPSDPSLKPSQTISRRRVKGILDEMLLKYNALLPNQTLVEIVVFKLLSTSTDFEPSMAILVKRKALELLNEKLISIRANDSEFWLEMGQVIIKQLLKHLPTKCTMNELNDLEIHNIQLIMLSFKLTCKFVDPKATKFNKIVFKAIRRVIQFTNSIKLNVSVGGGDDETSTQLSRREKLMQNLKGSCILSLTQMMSSLDLEGIEFVHNIVDIVTNNFDVRDDIILISNVSALQKIIHKFAQFISPYLQTILLRLLATYSLCDQIKNLRSKLQAISGDLSTLVPKRVIFKTIDESYDKVTAISPEAIIELMNLFKLSCANLEKTDLKIIVENTKGLMLKALNYRSKHQGKVDLATIERVESHLGEAFSVFILKLDETTFRPILYPLIDWSIRVEDFKTSDKKAECIRLPTERYYRMIAFYRFCSHLADQLKSLFLVQVATSLVDNCLEMLNAYHSDNKKNEEDKMDADNPLANKSNSEPKLRLDESDIGEPLVAAILATLSKCFMYDLDGVFVKDCTSLLIKPIINQISNVLGSEQDFNNRLDLILQCTQFLIQNNKDETLIKDFNYQILLKTTEANPKVRVGAIKVLHRLILVCNDDYLPFIPEAIPFIAELSEDENDTVEAHVKKIIIDIEQLIGEPISKYL